MLQKFVIGKNFLAISFVLLGGCSEEPRTDCAVDFLTRTERGATLDLYYVDTGLLAADFYTEDCLLSPLPLELDQEEGESLSSVADKAREADGSGVAIVSVKIRELSPDRFEAEEIKLVRHLLSTDMPKWLCDYSAYALWKDERSYRRCLRN